MSTPTESMLYHYPPELDFAADAITRVPLLAQVLKVLRRIETAGAVAIRDFGRPVHNADVAGSGRNAAPRLKMLPRKPRLAIERFQPRFIPPPNTMTHNGRDVVGNLH